MPKVVRKKQKSESNLYCCVPQCCSWLKKDRMISFHQFPKESSLNKKWHVVLKMGKQASTYMKVCSKHFKEDDYFLPGSEAKVPRLKRGAIPSQNLPISSHDAQVTPEQQARIEGRRIRLSKRSSAAAAAGDAVQVGSQNTVAEEALPSLAGSCSPAAAGGGAQLQDQECHSQAQSAAENEVAAPPEPGTATGPCPPAEPLRTEPEARSQCPLITELLNTEDKLRISTGIPSFELLYAINTLCQQHQRSECDMVESIVLVFMKLKLNQPFSFLQILFGKSTVWCSNTFFKTLPIISAVLSDAIYWPDKESVLQNMPKCFDKYKNTRVVVDCTEVPVERKTKCLKCRMATYSQYKGCHTVKFMVCVSPDGIITHVSNVFGGRVSDKVVFEESGVVEKLEPFVDAVMADKGFMIDAVLEERCIALHRPPFLRRQRQFSRADARCTAELASARVRVERVIGRLKTYKILVHKLPWRMVPCFRMIVKVVSAITNLSAPILASDKFASS